MPFAVKLRSQEREDSGTLNPTTCGSAALMHKGNNGAYSVVETKDAQALGSGNSKLIRSMVPIDGADICAPYHPT